MTATLEQRQPLLVGALVGDAVGFPFQGLRKGHVQQVAEGRPEGFLADPILFPDKPDKNHLPGLHSSLGQRLLASLAIVREDEMGRDPVARVGAMLLELSGGAEPVDDHDFGALRALGRPMRNAVKKWRENYPWDETDWFNSGDSEGVGPCAVGLIPVALGMDDTTDWCIRLTRLTHFRLLPLAGACAVAECAKLLLPHQGDKRIDGPGIAKELLERVREIETRLIDSFASEWNDLGWREPAVSLSHFLEPLGSLLVEHSDDLAASTIVRAAKESAPRLEVTHPQHGYVGAGLTWAIWKALSSESMPRTVEDVLNGGGETCGVGAVTMGLLGARFGTAGIPVELSTGCKAADVCKRILANPNETHFAELMTSESRWTAEEEAMRAPIREKLEKARMIAAARQKLNESKSGGKKAASTASSIDVPPPEHLWLKPGEEEDPKKKKLLKEARGRRRIDWKEDRRKKQRDTTD